MKTCIINYSSYIPPLDNLKNENRLEGFIEKPLKEMIHVLNEKVPLPIKIYFLLCISQAFLDIGDNLISELQEFINIFEYRTRIRLVPEMFLKNESDNTNTLSSAIKGLQAGKLEFSLVGGFDPIIRREINQGLTVAKETELRGEMLFYLLCTEKTTLKYDLPVFKTIHANHIASPHLPSINTKE